MQYIYFPCQYKKFLRKRLKNMTVRIGNEKGKYKKDHIYSVQSYAKRDWNLKIKVFEVSKLKLKELSKYGVHYNTIKSIQMNNVSLDDQVELIKFKVL